MYTVWVPCIQRIIISSIRCVVDTLYRLCTKSRDISIDIVPISKFRKATRSDPNMLLKLGGRVCKVGGAATYENSYRGDTT